MAGHWTCAAFGLRVVSDFPFPGMRRAEADADGEGVSVLSADWGELADLWSGEDARVWDVELDGEPCSLEHGTAGDWRFRYGERARYWLSDDLRTIRYAARDEEDLQ